MSHRVVDDAEPLDGEDVHVEAGAVPGDVQHEDGEVDDVRDEPLVADDDGDERQRTVRPVHEDVHHEAQPAD